MIYAIGERIWIRGEELTITTEPYVLGIGQWQDATGEDGKRHTVPTPGQKAQDAAEREATRQELQAGFRRLRESAK